MQTTTEVIDDLTTLLEGCDMGIHVFLSYVGEVKSLELKDELVKDIEIFKKHHKSLCNHIKSLNECPNTDEKMSVMMAEFMEKMKAQMASDDHKLLELALNAIDMALKAVQDFKKKHHNLQEDCLGAINDLENDYKKIYQNLIDLRLNNIS